MHTEPLLSRRATQRGQEGAYLRQGPRRRFAEPNFIVVCAALLNLLYYIAFKLKHLLVGPFSLHLVSFYMEFQRASASLCSQYSLYVEPLL